MIMQKHRKSQHMFIGNHNLFVYELEETFECAKGTMGYHYLLLSIYALETCLRVNVVMMDDNEQCLMVIEHIAFDY